MSAFDPKQTFIIRAFRIEGPLADCEKRERTLGLPITAWGGGAGVVLAEPAFTSPSGETPSGWSV